LWVNKSYQQNCDDKKFIDKKFINKILIFSVNIINIIFIKIIINVINNVFVVEN